MDDSAGVITFLITALDQFVQFLLNTAFWWALGVGVIVAVGDWCFKRRRNVQAKVGFELALGGTAMAVLLLFALGLSFAIGADVSVFRNQANSMAVATLAGAVAIVVQYLQTHPYDQPAVKSAQQLLRALGYTAVHVDGYCGEKTKEAVSRFIHRCIEGDMKDFVEVDAWIQSRKRKGLTFSATPSIMLLLIEAYISKTRSSEAEAEGDPSQTD